MTGESRRDRGQRIAQGGGVHETSPGVFTVVSDSRDGKSYSVQLQGDPCSCEDYRHGCPRSLDGICKHIWAVRFFLGMDKMQTEAQAGEQNAGGGF